MTKVYKAILLPDIHYPDHIRACHLAINPFIKDFQPDQIVYMGDQMSLDAVSTWNEGKPGVGELLRLKKDYEEFDVKFLRRHEKLAPKAKRVWIDGN